MFSLLKFTLTFCLSFLVLSIPIQNKPIFYYLNQWASPITQEVFSSSRGVILDGVKKGKHFGKKLFNNTTPKVDEINLQSSSIDKKSIQEAIDDHGETYTAEERNMLENILKDASHK